MSSFDELKKIFSVYERDFYIGNLPEASTCLEIIELEESISDRNVFKIFENYFFEGCETDSILIQRDVIDYDNSVELFHTFFEGGFRAAGHNKHEINRDFVDLKSLSIEIIEQILSDDNKIYAMYHENLELRDDFSRLTKAELELDTLGFYIGKFNKKYLLLFDWRFD